MAAQTIFPPARQDVSAMILDALVEAERFIAGFEDDPLQDDIDLLLIKVRGAIAWGKGRQP